MNRKKKNTMKVSAMAGKDDKSVEMIILTEGKRLATRSGRKIRKVFRRAQNCQSRGC